MKLKRFVRIARLAGAFVLGWTIVIAVEMLATAVITSLLLGVLFLVGTIFHVVMPYTLIAVLTAIVVLAVLHFFGGIWRYYVKRLIRRVEIRQRLDRERDSPDKT
jgi:uncharacterized membrane protein YqjE